MHQIKLTFLSVFSFGAVSTFIKVGLQLALNKVIALYLGINNFSYVTNFQNFFSVVNNLSGGIFSSGLVKLVAENTNNLKYQQKILSTSLLSQFFLSIICGILVICFSKEISILLFYTDNKKNYFILYGLLVFTFSINQLLLGYLNGKKQIYKYVKLEIINNAVVILSAIMLVYLDGFEGYLLAYSISGLIALLINTLFVSSILKRLSFKIDYKILRRLISFSIVVIISAIFGPIFKIFIRKALLLENGVTYSGYWDSLNKLSSLYMLFIIYPVSKYFMPQISSLQDRLSQIKFLKKTILISCIITLTFLTFFKFFSKEIISIGFSKDFSRANDFVNYQIIGDFLRVFCIVISNFFIGLGKLKYFIIIELFGYLSYYSLFRIFSIYSLQDSIFSAYVIMNFLTLLLSVFSVIHLIKIKKWKSIL